MAKRTTTKANKVAAKPEAELSASSQINLQFKGPTGGRGAEVTGTVTGMVSGGGQVGQGGQVEAHEAKLMVCETGVATFPHKSEAVKVRMKDEA